MTVPTRQRKKKSFNIIILNVVNCSRLVRLR